MRRRSAAFGVNGLASPNGVLSPFPPTSRARAPKSYYRRPGFINATGNGASLWKSLSYAQLTMRSIEELRSSRTSATSTPTARTCLRSRTGGKLIQWHGLADELIFPEASINYYSRVLSQMGGLANVQPFYRLFMVPGIGHSTPNGTSNPAANPPLPGPQQLYGVLTDWVEKGLAPNSIVLNSPSSTPVAKSQPICAYPTKATYSGSGDPNVAASYSCS